MRLPHDELIVASIDDVYPSPPEGDSASLKRWRSFSPFWWAVIQGLIEGLTQPILWREWSDDLHDEIVKHFLPEEPECEDGKGSPDKKYSSGGEEPAVGELGYTLEELEEMIMIVHMRPQFAYIGGIVHYYDAGCCEYLPLPTVEGEAPAPTTSAAIAAIAGGLVTMNNWEALGSPETGTVYPPIPHDNPLYQTDDSLACVKATALANSMRGWLNASADGVAESALSTMALVTIIDTIATYFNLAIAAAGSVAGMIWTIAVGTTAADWVSQFEAAADDPNWPELICDLVPRMSPVIDPVGLLKGTTVTESDYVALLEVMNDHITMGMKVVQVINAMPMSLFLNDARASVSNTDCGCNNFLPYGALPAVPSGSFMYSLSSQFGFASAGVPMPDDLAPYEAVFDGGSRGVIFGGDPTTEFDNESGGTYTSFLQAVFGFTDDVHINGIKMLFAFPDGVPDLVNWSNKYFTTEGGGQWKYGAGWGNYNDAPEVRSTQADLTAMSIGIWTGHAGAPRRASIVQVLISGTYLGDVFIDLPPETIFEAQV